MAKRDYKNYNILSDEIANDPMEEKQRVSQKIQLGKKNEEVRSEVNETGHFIGVEDSRELAEEKQDRAVNLVKEERAREGTLAKEEQNKEGSLAKEEQAREGRLAKEEQNREGRLAKEGQDREGSLAKEEQGIEEISAKGKQDKEGSLGKKEQDRDGSSAEEKQDREGSLTKGEQNREGNLVKGEQARGEGLVEEVQARKESIVKEAEDREGSLVKEAQDGEDSLAKEEQDKKGKLVKGILNKIEKIKKAKSNVSADTVDLKTKAKAAEVEDGKEENSKIEIRHFNNQETPSKLDNRQKEDMSFMAYKGNYQQKKNSKVIKWASRILKTIILIMLLPLIGIILAGIGMTVLCALAAIATCFGIGVILLGAVCFMSSQIQFSLVVLGVCVSVTAIALGGILLILFWMIVKWIISLFHKYSKSKRYSKREDK